MGGSWTESQSFCSSGLSLPPAPPAQCTHIRTLCGCWKTSFHHLGTKDLVERMRAGTCVREAHPQAKPFLTFAWRSSLTRAAAPGGRRSCGRHLTQTRKTPVMGKCTGFYGEPQKVHKSVKSNKGVCLCHLLTSISRPWFHGRETKKWKCCHTPQVKVASEKNFWK